jgi:hypothetical protein
VRTRAEFLIPATFTSLAELYPGRHTISCSARRATAQRGNRKSRAYPGSVQPANWPQRGKSAISRGSCRHSFDDPVNNSMSRVLRAAVVWVEEGKRGALTIFF